VRSYNQQIKTLRLLCQEHHIPMQTPFSDTDVCFLLQAYVRPGRKVTTVPLFLSAIQHFARQQWNVEYVIEKTRQLHETMVSLRRRDSATAVSVSKVPITLADLLAFHAKLDRLYFEHARTWCMALFAFFGLLRIGEYCDGSLHIGDVSAQPYGLDIVIRRSKTSAQPVCISLAARPDELCPVAALRRYSEFCALLRIPSSPHDPLFVVRTQGGRQFEAIKPQHFIDDIRDLIRHLFPSRTVDDYAGHSFRRGGCTAMLQAGVSQVIVQRHGRWVSDAFKRYLDSLSSPATRVIPTQALIHAPIGAPPRLP
jgi:integrase